MSLPSARRSTKPHVSTRLCIIWLTCPSETPSQMASASRDSTAMKQSSRLLSVQNLVVSLSSQTLGTRIRTVPGRRV